MASRDEILQDFQACTGIDDVEVAIMHLSENGWDLLVAINKVLPQDSQTLPSERPTVFGGLGGGGGGLVPNAFRNYAEEMMDQVEVDVPTVMDITDEDIELIHPIPVPPVASGSNGALRSAFGSSSSTSSSANKEKGGSSSSKVSLSSDFISSGPSGSKKREAGGRGGGGAKGKPERNIKFTVRLSDSGQKLEVSLAECENIDTLKTLIHAQFEIPPCQQKLTGWPIGDPKDGTKFGSLTLPDEINLTLTEKNSLRDLMAAAAGTSRTAKPEEEKITLMIQDEMTNKTNEIHYDGSKSVRGVKEDTADFTDIPVRLQVWSGWPEGVIDSMKLCECGLDKPHHTLSVKKQLSAPSSSADLSKKMMELGDGSETSSDVEDLTESYPLEEDYFAPETTTAPVAQRFLIPDNTADEAVGTIQFADNFFARYGSCHPMFYQGALEDAVKEACMQPARNRKPLAIYLHHDASVVSNVFCQHILCNESIVNYLTNNFVIWGWDVTNESNRQMLLNIASKNFGTPGSGTIRSIPRERYPVIIIVTRVRATTEISSVIYGPDAATVDELMGNLMHNTEMYQNQRQADVREEDEREARERVKREQDEAYQLSLIADRAKDEAKRAEEMKKIEEEQKEQQQAQEKQMMRDHVATTLPPEPLSSSTEPMCSLKCRLPGGKVVSRRFLQVTPLSVLFDFLFSQGFSRDEYRFLTTYPKRDISEMPESTPVKNIFSPQDTMIVEER